MSREWQKERIESAMRRGEEEVVENAREDGWRREERLSESGQDK